MDCLWKNIDFMFCFIHQYARENFEIMEALLITLYFLLRFFPLRKEQEVENKVLHF